MSSLASKVSVFEDLRTTAERHEYEVTWRAEGVRGFRRAEKRAGGLGFWYVVLLWSYLLAFDVDEWTEADAMGGDCKSWEWQTMAGVVTARSSGNLEN